MCYGSCLPSSSGSCVVMFLPLLTSTVGSGTLRKDLRVLEDKLDNHRVEFRTFVLTMDMADVHNNREMPAGFTMYLCVSDATLPAKGTAHRTNRNSAEKACLGINCFFSIKAIQILFSFSHDAVFRLVSE